MLNIIQTSSEKNTEVGCETHNVIFVVFNCAKYLMYDKKKNLSGVFISF